jgi:uncharacterized phage-associated protein
MTTTSVFDVARYLLEKERPMPDLKLQKLCYYAQAWSLVWEDAPLFQERLEAWRDGPVCPALYRAQKHAWEELRGDYALTNRQKMVIDRVFSAYGQKSANDLSELTHREDPWRDARGEAQPNEPTYTAITNDDIRAYFSGLTKSAREWQESETFEEAAAAVVAEHAEVLRRLA